MGIMYLISILMLLIVFVLIKKTEKEVNLLNFIGISIVALFCYNTFICYILTFFMIPIKLWFLTLLNILISVVFLVLILRNKKVQKFTIEKIDFLFIIIIALVVIVISYINFGFPFGVNYEIGGDSATHFLASIMFAEEDFLLAAEPKCDYIFGTLKTFKPASYVNSGLLMKSICPEVDTLECYNIFAFFGILIFFLTGANIYSAMRSFAKNKEHKLWALILALICMLGYPLNTFLFGFEYLSMGLLILSTIICFINYYEKNILSLKWFIPIMALLCFGLFLSYYMFVPFVYPALWIYFCIKNYTKTKKIVTKELVLLLVVSLLIPFGLGFIYTIAPNIYSIFIDNQTDLENVMANSKYLISSGFQNNGYIYINLYSNMLLLLPLPIYMFVKDIKNKNIKNNIFTFLVLFFNIAFIGILLIGNYLGKVSIYYVTKNYFALWIILIYSNYKALLLLSKNSNYLSRLFIGTYIFLMIILTIFSNVKLEYRIKNKDENITTVMEIFGANKTILFEKQKEFTNEQLKIFRYAKDNLDFSKEIEVVTDLNAYFWQYALLQYVNQEQALDNIDNGQSKLEYKLATVNKKIGRVDYIIYFNKNKVYNFLEDELFKDAEIIYENSSGGILKYNR